MSERRYDPTSLAHLFGTGQLGTSQIPGTGIEPFISCLKPEDDGENEANAEAADAIGADGDAGGLPGATLAAKLPDGSWVPISDPRARQAGAAFYVLAQNPHPAPVALNARGGVVIRLPRALQLILQQPQQFVNPPPILNPPFPPGRRALPVVNRNAGANAGNANAGGQAAGKGNAGAAQAKHVHIHLGDGADPCERDVEDARVRVDETAVTGIAAGSGSWASIVSFTVPQGFRAHVEKFGVEVSTGVVANWRWRVVVNGTPQRPWAEMVYPPGGMAPHEMAPCNLVLKPNDKVEIQAYQTDGGTINAYGRILGVMKQC